MSKECKFPGCEHLAWALGWCNGHYRQNLDGREMRPLRPFGGRTGRCIDSHGYALVKMPEHPNAWPSNGYVLEHVLVVTKILGRPLRPGENVHHVNGVRDDNRPENLELWATPHPRGQRVFAFSAPLV